MTTEHGVTTSTGRQFWTYWAASTTSGLGTAVTAVALPLVAVIVLHASALEMGLLTGAAYVGWLVIGLPAGAVVRHLPLRRTQRAMDLVRAAAIASVPLGWWLGGLTVPDLIGVAMVISFADVVFFVANSTFLPRVVPKEQLQQRNSLMSGTHAVTTLGGPSLGGVLVQLLGGVTTMALDAASYVVSAVLLRRLPEPEIETALGRTSVREEVREGWSFVTRHPVMRAVVLDATAVNFVSGAQLALFTVYLVRDLGAPPALVGVLIATEGLGSLVGAAVTPALARQLGTARMCMIGALVASIGAFVIPATGGVAGLVAFTVGNVVFAGGVVVTSIVTRTFRQVATPPELLSRVMATVRFISWGAIPVGGLVAGAAGQWWGPRTALIVFAVLSLLSPLAVLLSPVRYLRDLPEALPAH